MEIFGIDKKLKVLIIASSGLKSVNSDSAFEKLLKDNGINPRDLAKIEKEEPELWDKVTKNPGGIRDRVKQLTKTKEVLWR